MEQYPTGPYDSWGLQEEIRLLKVAQFEHNERLSQHSERLNKLEKQYDNPRDHRIRSLWSSPSPFPAPLSTYSQQPSNHDTNLNDYDHQQQHQNLVLSGLQLDDVVDVPRRGASRANSVRFDDSATTNHWIHDSPGTSDYFGQRSTNTSLHGGYAMTDRSSSHKSDIRSDGRQSIRSFVGELSSSYEGDNIFPPPTSSGNMMDTILHPAVSKTSPAPAMLRCWLDTAPSYDPLLYAIVCTGSARSSIEMSLVVQQHMEHRICRSSDGSESRITLPVFLPDAIVQHNSRITAPTKIPRITVDFIVLPICQPKSQQSEIRVFLGSDVISAHMVDVLFSQSRVFLTCDDGRKVQVPFVRPESEEIFSDIFTAHSGDYIPRHTADASTNGSGNTNGINKTDDLPRPKSSSPAPNSSGESTKSISSPRPIHGGQASVIRGVASMEPSVSFTSPSLSRPPSAQLVPPPKTTSTTIFNAEARPWTALADSRKDTSFPGGNGGGVGGNNNFTNNDPFANSNSKSDEAITRGRSLTNPFEDLPMGMGMGKGQGGSRWDVGPTTTTTTTTSHAGQQTQQGGRKQSMTYAAPLKEGTGNAQTGGSGLSGSQGESYSRASSRGMKVLRTSKSFSSQGGQGGGEAKKGPTVSVVPTTPGTIGNKGHGRTMSGGDAVGKQADGKTGVARAKSSNVVGGATAFKWMAPKEAE
ncbi:hypothetical protein BZA77DRAFT_300594 [Pyronema omphalodes]|nr:hypothetical protein BZA77DRAFT_300594 [Pyronema omphalodes]